MKKILSVILVIAMLCGVLVTGVGADKSKEFIFEDLQYAMNDYKILAEFLGGYFAEGSSPGSGAIFQNALYIIRRGGYEEYLVNVDEYGFETYHIPADVYENELVFVTFARTDAILETLHSAEYYRTDKAEPYYEVFIGGGFGGMLPSYVMQSYKLRDDGLYEAYAACAFTIPEPEFKYTPAEGDVEGRDYVVVCAKDSEYNEKTDSYDIGYTYVCGKVMHGIKMVFDLNEGSGYPGIYHAFEEIAKEDILLSGNGDSSIYVPENEPDLINIGGMNMEAIVELEPDTFIDGTRFFGEEYYNDDEEGTISEEYNETAEILKTYGTLAGVYGFVATKDGETVQPNDKVKVEFLLPNNFSPECALYCIAEDGIVEIINTEIETVFDEETGVAAEMNVVAELEHLGRYAVAGTLFGDVDEDGSVALTDVTEMLKKIAGWDVYPNEIAMDVNRDGSANLSDVTLVLEYIAGWDVQFGAEYSEVSDNSGWVTPDYVDVQLIDVNEYSRPGTKLETVNGIVVHYVANPGTSAAANRSYFAGLAQSGATYASSNFIIGLEGEVLQCVPADEIAYASNSRNKDTLSIENCHPDETGKFTDATYDSLVKLCADICLQFDLDPATDIIRHHDVTGKLCPKYFVEHEDAWHTFLSDVADAVVR